MKCKKMLGLVLVAFLCFFGFNSNVWAEESCSGATSAANSTKNSITKFINAYDKASNCFSSANGGILICSKEYTASYLRDLSNQMATTGIIVGEYANSDFFKNECVAGMVDEVTKFNTKRNEAAALMTAYQTYVNETEAYTDTERNEVNSIVGDFKNHSNGYVSSIIDIDLGDAQGCDGILGETVLDLLNKIFGWFQIIAPILLILFASLDLSKAVLSGDQKTVQKSVSDTIKRAIAAVALFFLPLIIRIVLNMPGVKDTLKLDEDPLCEIGR